MGQFFELFSLFVKSIEIQRYTNLLSHHMLHGRGFLRINLEFNFNIKVGDLVFTAWNSIFSYLSVVLAVLRILL